MKDESIVELLSRHLDGDLDPDEERALKARIDGDPALAERLESMVSLRRSLAALAAEDMVPAKLDRVIEPLLSGNPEPLMARPWARWLATAAIIVVGATVVIEVNRRNSGPGIRALARVADEAPTGSHTPFPLAPLPTSSIPVDEQPLGATDRLLASPIPEIELEEPRALEILGPLSGTEEFTPSDEGAAAEAGDLAPARPAPTEGGIAQERPEQPAPAEAPGRQKSDAAGKQPAIASEADAGLSPRPWESDRPWGRAKLFVFVDGKSAWREFAPAASCKPGRYAVRIIVRDGAVREARPVGGATSASPSQRVCAAQLIVDLEIADVADGEYPAEVVVERRSAGP